MAKNKNKANSANGNAEANRLKVEAAEELGQTVNRTANKANKQKNK